MTTNFPRFLSASILCIAAMGPLPLSAHSAESAQRIEQAWRFLDAEAGLAMAAMKEADRPTWWPDRVACRGMVVNFWGGGVYVLAGFEPQGRASLVAITAPTSLNFFQALDVMKQGGLKEADRVSPELPVKWERRDIPSDLLTGVLHAFHVRTKDPKYDNLMGPLALDPVTFLAKVPGDSEDLSFSAGADSFLLGDPKAFRAIMDARVQTAWGLRVLERAAEPEGSERWPWVGSVGARLKGFALNLAVETQDREAIRKLLVDGMDPNAPPPSRYPGGPDWDAPTPLGLAAGGLDVGSVSLLLNGGAKAQGDDIEKPLDGAVLAGGYVQRGSQGFPTRGRCLEIVKMLLAAGADPKHALEIFTDADDMDRDPVILKALQEAAKKAQP